MKQWHPIQFRSKRRRYSAGFTLLELLVVVFIIGILAAIAAPTWDKLLSRQRVTTAREQVMTALRQAQSEARRSRTPRVVFLDPNESGDRPRIVTTSYAKLNPVTFTTVQGWQNIGQSDIPAGTIQLAVERGGSPVTDQNQRRVIFDGDGAVDRRTDVPLYIVLQGSKAGPGDRRCIVVETRLGSMRTGQGTECKP
ncbi:MAG TPA: GspH/FimT family pseudopilin [Leptolyngbyaceae cyanobacterium M33_DOE_097]|uniref:Type II secretion system protein GspH n=1 Tax=Oscillatoriales cyanobacterium SpSt-418 TaxID=2282169 RepID=A0A7C3KJQ8_9CYAN|nr:GspH/FimT family pseudopilin [Leptolyngbyaceae cyanobacterium M33_DOE_097]